MEYGTGRCGSAPAKWAGPSGTPAEDAQAAWKEH